jgi:hypothetical protein
MSNPISYLVIKWP